jgi:type IV secretory pathway VirJ component
MGRGPWENAPRPMSMNEQVAYAVIDSELNRLRKSPYSDLTALVGKPETKQVIAEDSKSYKLEIQAVWASKKGGDLMVIVSADDGGWRAFKPLTCDFIMRPDGTFVGESFGGY